MGAGGEEGRKREKQGDRKGKNIEKEFLLRCLEQQTGNVLETRLQHWEKNNQSGENIVQT